jgi:hypothetical protein
MIRKSLNYVSRFFQLNDNSTRLITQQQQQHSLLSQASWGRLEIKPKRDEKQGDT